MTETTDTSTLDLASLDLEPGADKGAEMQLRHPITGAPLGISFTVVGQDGTRYRSTLRRLREQVAKNPAAEPAEPDAASRLQHARSAAASVHGWCGDVVLWGEKLAFSFDNCVKLMLALPWVADQVSFFRDTRGNFFGG